MYLDPGFGSMIIQLIVAAIAAGGAYAVVFRKKIKEFFDRKRGIVNDKKSDNEEE